MKRSAPTERQKDRHHFVQCPQCDVSLRSNTLSRHLNIHQPFVSCQNCSKSVRSDKMERHLILCKDGVDERLCNRKHVERLPQCSRSSLNGFFQSFDLNVESVEEYDGVLQDVGQESRMILEELLKVHPLKSQIIITISFIHHDLEGEVSYTEATFRTHCEPILMGDNIEQYVGRVTAELRLAIENFERMGSGWVYNSLISAKLEIAKFSPFSLC